MRRHGGSTEGPSHLVRLTGQVYRDGVSETLRLLADARDGDRAAFDALFVRHRGRLLAYATTRLGGGARFTTADDIVQETHLEAARKLDGFSAQGPAAFYRWLVTIARYKIMEAQRGRAAGDLLAEPAADLTSPSGRVMRGERAAGLASALEQLTAEQAEAVRMRYLEGLSVAETAQRLGKSAAAAKMLVSRGLGRLASLIAGASGTSPS